MRCQALLEVATGSSKDLDRAIARDLDVPHRDYSSSVDACLQLVCELLPSAHWHVGRAEDGVSFYASLTDGSHREEGVCVTVPLAILKALVKFLKENRRSR